MSKIPIGCIIDDSGPVNTCHFHNPDVEHPLKVSCDFARRFAAICSANGVKGKFSLVPMPACLGRLDKALAGFSKAEIRRYLKLIKEQIEPRFSITPEVLTHFRAYNLQTNRFMHVFEDVYFASIDARTMSEYIGLAIEILCNAGLNPTGLTSPWMCGLNNEGEYARGIGLAFKKTLQRNRCFYFLHCQDEVKEPVVMCNSEETGKVVSIPAVTDDAFWGSQRPNSKARALALVRRNINRLLAPDGRSGALLELLEQGRPITLLTHWQSLFSDGTAIGLEGFETLTSRINRYLGRQLEWMTLEEIALLQ